jgi:hypothetical protein
MTAAIKNLLETLKDAEVEKLRQIIKKINSYNNIHIVREYKNIAAEMEDADEPNKDLLAIWVKVNHHLTDDEKSIAKEYVDEIIKVINDLVSMSKTYIVLKPPIDIDKHPMYGYFCVVVYIAHNLNIYDLIN